MIAKISQLFIKFIKAVIMKLQCRRRRQRRPGDGFDNDCDGRIDEEVRDGKDNDGDGRIDEDLELVRFEVTSLPAKQVIIFKSKLKKKKHYVYSLSANEQSKDNVRVTELIMTVTEKLTKKSEMARTMMVMAELMRIWHW